MTEIVVGLYDYRVSQEILSKHYPFYATLMALMYNADTDNAFKLRTMFPQVWDELQARYNAPDGLLEGDRIARSDE